jgi:hypothetical protein
MDLRSGDLNRVLFASVSPIHAAFIVSRGEWSPPQRSREILMRTLVFAFALVAGASIAHAQGTASSCQAQATTKKLAGAALTSFMTKCQKDAAASCDRAAADKKLAGAAKSSFSKKCVSDAVGK